ncbi:AAA family ATPase [Facklamia miroungae]|uniref:Uncharacterized protein n=1 Tax=Facklamia miroungae TaxID=120956 RepID=A0A1G7UGE8_9LACT|nr:AAA family ATPase [Facklamia miroungae]NKZ30117.1 AAA family ATPase [Facklamia miroungae]SDG46564.1 hypothetical protein SAMN05421791_1106 [Facklamia miroungae]
MAGKIVLARAGSGKTYYIANDFEENKSVLLITFTRQNVKNIYSELEKRFSGSIPKNIRVTTFSSFIYSWLLRPIEPLLSFENVKSSGVDIFNKPPENTFNPVTKKRNPYYIKDSKIEHYINPANNKYYSDRISKLIFKQKKYIWKTVEKRLDSLLDIIYVDEFQDFKGYDYKILLLLLKSNLINITAVGDFFQHSVSMNNFKSNNPFKKNNVYISEEKYIESLPAHISIDRNSLIKSIRVPNVVCQLIKNKLNISIESNNSVDGILEEVTDSEKLNKLLVDINCVKLVNKNSKKMVYKPAINWGYSKGDTYPRVLIILTGTFEKLLKDDFNADDLSQKIINELYVALTRSNNEVYICRKSVFDKFLEDTTMIYNNLF